MGGHVVIAGGSGLIGGALTWLLQAEGFRITHLVRRPPAGSHEVEWLTAAPAHLDPAVLDGADAVICLNGASIGRLPWTASYRRTLRESRLIPTRTLATALRELGTRAPAFLCASAVGYYGDRPGEALDETSSQGSTFLAELCGAWEREALAAGRHTRVVLLRTAPLLHAEGVLKPMIALARLGLSGPLGRGTQLWPWISLDDEVRAIRHLIGTDIEGPVNLCGPTRASADEIGRALATALHRPYLLPAPAPALRLGLGSDAAESLLLADADVRPAVLERSGFEFEHPTAAQAIAAALAG
ncbi:TIGR01777 family oxidoreductase [Leucobacter tenebrionis]|uniref:TIGR01777 family oxidoreductase n=1 Tax=Leucobacter tenebrionis TaxID=2873270 RepID=UPI001CA75456|nr:TIGR01777 family oxidoreductase [Leucobacter tenebrionis]QZY51973.1 TIGR01777 family oxidoreductase [Leucobacter tenebrionis]